MQAARALVDIEVEELARRSDLGVDAISAMEAHGRESIPGSQNALGVSSLLSRRPESSSSMRGDWASACGCTAAEMTASAGPAHDPENDERCHVAPSIVGVTSSRSRRGEPQVRMCVGGRSPGLKVRAERRLSHTAHQCDGMHSTPFASPMITSPERPGLQRVDRSIQLDHKPVRRHRRPSCPAAKHGRGIVEMAAASDTPPSSRHRPLP